MSEKQKECETKEINISEIVQDLKNNKIPDLNKQQVKQLFDELDVAALNDLFNDSVKNLFDFGFKLANSLNLSKILDIFEEKNGQQNRESMI